MKKILFAFLLLASGLMQQAQAQSRSVSGKVTDRATSEGLPGVTVVVKGQPTIGTSTNADGSFTLSGVPDNASALVMSYVGFSSQEVSIAGVNSVTVALGTDTKQLGEVVVTALGREQSRKTLGYSVQDIKGSEFTQARETNVVNSLTGKIAGVQVTSGGGAAGSSSRIIIRGAKSISQNSQPLFVIDGQPIDNSSFSNSTTSGGIDYGNAVSDINPDDIESMTVLKGANASALYGSRGANGVIVITTKNGRRSRGLGIAVNSTTSFETPLLIPKLQAEYGQGSAGEFSYVDGDGSGLNDNFDESWGPRLDGRLIPQYNSPVVNGVRQGTPWVAPARGANNIRDFFETGHTLTNNIALSGGNEKAGVRLSYTNLDQKGLLPNTFLRRNTVNVNGGVDVTSKFKFSTSINYSETQGRRPGQGYDELNVMQQLYTWYGRQVDVNDLRSLYNNSNGSNANWNTSYHNNPYYVLNVCTNDDLRRRIIGNLTLNYAVTDWLNLTARTTNDYYSQFNQRRVGAQTVSNAQQDDYTEEKISVLERNTEFLATATRNITEDISLDAVVGANRLDAQLERSQIAAPNLAVPGLFTLSNSSTPLVVNGNFDANANTNNDPILNPVQNRRVNSIYGSAKFGYKDFIFLGFTARNDYFSQLNSKNRSTFYPSVDAAVVLTEALKLQDSFLSFAKIRASYAEAGNGLTPPYVARQAYFGSQPFGSLPTQTVGNAAANPNLKTERTLSTEAGVELRFFKDRINLEVTGYNATTRDQIVAVPFSASTGFTTNYLNLGEINNRGVEAVLGIAPFASTSPFQWNITTNFAANRNRVVKFDDEGNVKNLVLGTAPFNLNVEARIGEKYGALFGNDFQRAPDGQIIYGANGFPLVNATRSVLGSYTPDWVGGITNQFTYKGILLSITIDTRRGGQLYSETNRWGNYTGALASTLEGREDGIVGQGVVRNPDGTFSPNTTRVSAQDYNENYYDITNSISSIYNASFTKLREIRLGYQLPKSLVEKSFLKGVGVSFVGRNLFLLESKAPNIDPETATNNGNVQGLESTQIPSTRSYGFNINFTL